MSSIKEANKHIQMLYQRLYDSERQKDLVIENKDKGSFFFFLSLFLSFYYHYYYLKSTPFNFILIIYLFIYFQTEIEELREKIKALEKINQTQEDRIKHLQYSTSLFSTKLEELNNICQKELNENDGL